MFTSFRGEESGARGKTFIRNFCSEWDRSNSYSEIQLILIIFLVFLILLAFSLSHNFVSFPSHSRSLAEIVPRRLPPSRLMSERKWRIRAMILWEDRKDRRKGRRKTKAAYRLRRPFHGHRQSRPEFHAFLRPERALKHFSLVVFEKWNSRLSPWSALEARKFSAKVFFQKLRR